MDQFTSLFGGLAFTIVASTIGFIILSFVVVFVITRMVNGANKKKVESLMATGKQGTATVISLEDTGMRINDNPRVRVGLEINIPNYPPYQVVKTITIPLIRMAQVQVGSTIAVVADPTQPNNSDKLGLLLR
jgi:hypothetical protein